MRTQLKLKDSVPTPFTFSGALPYADKSEYIDKDLVFRIVAIDYQKGMGFEGSDRWAVTVERGDLGGEELLTFGCNEKRNAQMQAAATHIKQHGPIANTHLKKVGRAYYLESAAVSKA